jgi:hypothetical protein
MSTWHLITTLRPSTINCCFYCFYNYVLQFIFVILKSNKTALARDFTFEFPSARWPGCQGNPNCCLQTSPKMPLPEVEEILKKYQQQEQKVDNLFQNRLFSCFCMHESGICCFSEKQEHNRVGNNNKTRKFPSFEAAKERNKTVLRDLETVKGNLRSKAIFSPTEMQWEAICKRYQEEPSLPVTTWRCNIPIFV